jgi:hypothetical protein
MSIVVLLKELKGLINAFIVAIYKKAKPPNICAACAPEIT